MCSVGGTECVAYIIISQISQFLAELFAVLGLFSAAETCILQKNYIAFLHSFYSLGSCFAGYIVIRYENNFLA